MKNPAASLIIIGCILSTALLASNAYAFPNKAVNIPFKLLEKYAVFPPASNVFEKHYSLIKDKSIISENDEDILDLDEETKYYVQKNSNNKRYFRAAIETLTLLGMVSTYYWATKSSSDDFDYDVSFSTLKKKFSGEAVLFDDNSIGINSFPGHPISGSYYYLIARNNNLSRIESFLWSFAASSIHELFVEFTEVASINDSIVTPVAGAAIGEAMYRFGRYFRCAKNKDTLTYKIASAIIDPIALVNSFIWDDTNYKFRETCHYDPIQNEFSIFGGMSTVYHENTAHFENGFIFGFHGKLYLLPYYGQVSDIKRFFSDTAFTEIGLEGIVTDARVDGLRFLAKTVWSAYHRQKIARTSIGNVAGYSFFVGLTSAFEHTQYETGEFEDWIGAVHILGPSTEFTYFHNDGYIRLNLAIFGDFAMVRSFAFDEYKRSYSLNGIKSILKGENYYYAYGVHINPKVEVKYGSYRFLAEFKYAHYDSIEGVDRIRSTNDFHLVDRLEEYSLKWGRLIDFLDFQFFKTHQTWVEAEVRRIARSGFIADNDVSHNGGNTWLLLRFKMLL